MSDKYNQIKQTWKIKIILNETANDWKESYGCYPTIKEFINLINEYSSVSLNTSNILIEDRLITSNDITWLSKIIINEQAVGEAKINAWTDKQAEDFMKSNPGARDKVTEIRKRYAEYLRQEAAKARESAEAKRRNPDRVSVTPEEVAKAPAGTAPPKAPPKAVNWNDKLQNIRKGTLNVAGNLIGGAPMVFGSLVGARLGHDFGGTGSPAEFAGEVAGGLVGDRLVGGWGKNNKFGLYKGGAWVGNKVADLFDRGGSAIERRMPIPAKAANWTAKAVRATGNAFSKYPPSSIAQTTGLFGGLRAAMKASEWWRNTDIGKQFAKDHPNIEATGEFAANLVGAVGGHQIPRAVDAAVKSLAKRIPVVKRIPGKRIPGLGFAAAAALGLATGAEAGDVLASLNPLEVLGGSSISSAGEGPDYDSVGNYVGPDWTETEEYKLETKKIEDAKQQWEKEHPTQHPLSNMYGKYDPNDQSGNRAPQQMRGQLKEFINKHVQRALLKEFRIAELPYQKQLIEPFTKSLTEPMVKVIKPFAELTKKETSRWIDQELIPVAKELWRTSKNRISDMFDKEAPKVLEKEVVRVPTNHPITVRNPYHPDPLYDPIDPIKLPTAAPPTKAVPTLPLKTDTSTDLGTDLGTGLGTDLGTGLATDLETVLANLRKTKTKTIEKAIAKAIAEAKARARAKEEVKIITKTDPAEQPIIPPPKIAVGITDKKDEIYQNDNIEFDSTVDDPSAQDSNAPTERLGARVNKPAPYWDQSTNSYRFITQTFELQEQKRRVTRGSEDYHYREDTSGRTAAEEEYYSDSDSDSSKEEALPINTTRLSARVNKPAPYWDQSTNSYKFMSHSQNIAESHSGTLNTKSALQARAKKQRYKVTVMENGKKLEVFATSIRGIRRVVYGKKNFRVHDSKGADITNYFKRLMSSNKSA